MKTLLLGFLSFLSLNTYALTTWIGPATMDAAAYNTASNWSPAGVPTASEAININTTVTIIGAIPMGAANAINILNDGSLTIATGITVTTGDVSVTGLTGTLINNGTFTAHNLTYGNVVGAVITNNGAMNLNNLNMGNGTLSGTFNNNGALAVAVNIVVEEGVLSNASSATITTFGANIQPGGTISNAGSFTSLGSTSAAKIDISSGGTFNNQAGATLTIDISTSNAYALDVSGSFTNAGTVNVGHNPYNPGSRGIINRNTGNYMNTGTIRFQIDPANCVITDNHGVSGSYISAPVVIISGSNCGEITLPVKLVSFNGFITGSCTAILSWKTTEEINFSHFEVQQSHAAGSSYTTVAKVESLNNPSGSSYQFSHAGVKDGANYYRLAMVDLDGHVDYSNIIQLSKNCNNTTVSFYPNPVADQLFVSNIRAGVALKLLDQQGRTVVEKRAAGEYEIINTSRLPAGVYILSVYSKNTGEKAAYKLVKQ